MRTDLPTKPPTGLTLRPYAGADDVPVIVDIINRELEHDGVPFRESVGEMGARYAHPSTMFEPARDVTIAEIAGAPVAYGERSWVDTTLDNLREYRVDGAVLPQWRRRGAFCCNSYWTGTQSPIEDLATRRLEPRFSSSTFASSGTSCPRLCVPWSPTWLKCRDGSCRLHEGGVVPGSGLRRSSARSPRLPPPSPRGGRAAPPQPARRPAGGSSASGGPGSAT